MATVVIGAGAVGAAAAYHLTRRRERVILLEQFTVGHDRGSSHGVARIIRHSYADSTCAWLMPAAFQAWSRLEAESSQSLVLRTGGVSACPKGLDYVAQVAANLFTSRIPFHEMTGAEWNRKHSDFRFPHDAEVVYEPDAGVVLAERALKSMIGIAKETDRCEIRENCPVERVDLGGPRPLVYLLSGEAIRPDRLVIAAGSWVGRLLPALARRFIPTRQEVFYFVPEPREKYEIGGLPIWIWMGEDPSDRYYGMPSVMGSGVKAARHGGPACDPDSVSREIRASDRESTRRALGKLLPALGDAPIRDEEICLYTMTRDEQFVVDFWPGRNDVVIASPCSGHGFKFSCLVGKIIAGLTLHGRAARRTREWRSLAGCRAAGELKAR
jgi:sarcosine oxidase